jgi:peptidoglycan/LPS O-acetylase OafA/YrhL
MGLLRVLLAISVFMVHAPQASFNTWLSGFGGSNAVEIFFLVSGFFIALILDKQYSTKLGFYKNRILKLYPIYYFICGLVIVRALVFPFFGESLISFPPEALAVGTFANSTLFGSDWLMFLQWENGNLQFGSFANSEVGLWQMLLIPQSWSIGIELVFYLMAPLLCKAKTTTLSFFGAALLLARFAGYFSGLDQDPWTYRFFPFELPIFVVGILLYRLHESRQFPKIPIKRIYPFLIVFFVAFGYSINKLSINQFWQMLILIGIAGAIILFGEQTPGDKKLGELSYPIYMSHLFVLSTYSASVHTLSKRFQSIEKLNDPSLAIPLCLVFTILFSVLLLRLVKPIENIRNKNRW